MDDAEKRAAELVTFRQVELSNAKEWGVVYVGDHPTGPNWYARGEVDAIRSAVAECIRSAVADALAAPVSGGLSDEELGEIDEAIAKCGGGRPNLGWPSGTADKYIKRLRQEVTHLRRVLHDCGEDGTLSRWSQSYADAYRAGAEAMKLSLLRDVDEFVDHAVAVAPQQVRLGMTTVQAMIADARLPAPHGPEGGS